MKKVKETKKSLKKDSQLFEVVDYSEGGSTRQLETEVESSEENSQNVKTEETKMVVSEGV